MIVQRWHRWANQPTFDKAWHDQDVADELAELREAKGLVHNWSEVSDVVYTVTRGRYGGHDMAYPIPRWQVAAGYAYMYPKYTSRILFFRRAGKKAGAPQTVQSVRNPQKLHKIETIARDNNLDPALFVTICQRQMKRWPLLP